MLEHSLNSPLSPPCRSSPKCSKLGFLATESCSRVFDGLVGLIASRVWPAEALPYSTKGANTLARSLLELTFRIFLTSVHQTKACSELSDQRCTLLGIGHDDFQSYFARVPLFERTNLLASTLYFVLT